MVTLDEGPGPGSEGWKDSEVQEGADLRWQNRTRTVRPAVAPGPDKDGDADSGGRNEPVS